MNPRNIYGGTFIVPYTQDNHFEVIDGAFEASLASAIVSRWHKLTGEALCCATDWMLRTRDKVYPGGKKGMALLSAHAEKNRGHIAAIWEWFKGFDGLTQEQQTRIISTSAFDSRGVIRQYGQYPISFYLDVDYARKFFFEIGQDGAIHSCWRLPENVPS